MKTMMMKVRYFLCCTGFLCLQPAIAQNSLNIEVCQQKARENFPVIKQHNLLDLSEQYNLSNLGKAYLPQISLNAQATYQSDVMTLPINIPGVDIPSINKDQYKATIDVVQNVWDGGMTSAQQTISRSANDVERQNTEVTLYTVRERINNLYFGILMLDEQLKQIDILYEDLKIGFNIVTGLKQNGAAMQSDVDAVRVEMLNAEQNKTELLSSRKAYAEMLSSMIDEKITEQTVFEKPTDALIGRNDVINRPEILLFDRQRSLFDAQKSMITAKNRPKLFLFLQGGYGKPGLNMLSNNFDFFGVGGVRLNWEFGNLYTKSNETKLIATNQNMVNIREETFLYNTNLQLMQIYNEVEKAKDLMKKDDEIIELRNRIKRASENKYQNGVYTVNDLLKDIHAENQSRQAKILHEIRYLMSIYNYKLVVGY